MMTSATSAPSATPEELAAALDALAQDGALVQALEAAPHPAARLRLLAQGLAGKGLAVSPAQIETWLGLPPGEAEASLPDAELEQVAAGLLSPEVVDAVTIGNLKRPDGSPPGASLPNLAYLAGVAGLVGVRGAGWGRIGAEW